MEKKKNDLRCHLRRTFISFKSCAIYLTENIVKWHIILHNMTLDDRGYQKTRRKRKLRVEKLWKAWASTNDINSKFIITFDSTYIFYDSTKMLL